MTITLNPVVAERLQKAAEVNHKEPGEYQDALLSDVLPPSPERRYDDDVLLPPYVRPTETPAWVWELIEEAKARGAQGMRAVWGRWPGDETDEEVNATLKALS